MAAARMSSSMAIPLLALAAGAGILLFSGGSAKASPAGPKSRIGTPDCDVADLPEPMRSEVIHALTDPTVTADGLDNLARAIGELHADGVLGTGCAKAAKTVQDEANRRRKTPVPVPPPPPVPSTKIFDPRNAPDPTRAHSLAVAIGNSEDPSNPGHTFPTLRAFAAFPGNASAIVALQESSGITADGVVGTQTQRAFDYFFVHTS